MFHVPEASRITDGPMGTKSDEGEYGAFYVPSPEPGWLLALICDDGSNANVPDSLGWEHVSVNAIRGKRSRMPTWKEMVFVKDLCWDGEDVVVQYHPRKSEYVNVHPHVLHLWRPVHMNLPTPPSFLVGPRPATSDVEKNAGRYTVVPEHNHHGGDGWVLFDQQQQRTTGGWFADRSAAEQTAAVLNKQEP